MEEVWKDIKDFDGLYQVSNYGRVRNTKTGRITTGCVDSQGYPATSFQMANKGYLKVNIHRLVAEYFIPNPDNLPFVNHKDEDKTNNRADNLEWCTQKYNLRYKNTQKRMRENSGRKKKIEVFDKAGNKLAEYNSVNEAAEGIGVTRGFVSKVLNGRAKRCKGLIVRVKETKVASEKAKAAALEEMPTHTSVYIENRLARQRKAFAMGYDRAVKDICAAIEKKLDALYEIIPDAHTVDDDTYTKEQAYALGKYVALESIGTEIV